MNNIAYLLLIIQVILLLVWIHSFVKKLKKEKQEKIDEDCWRRIVEWEKSFES